VSILEFFGLYLSVGIVCVFLFGWMAPRDASGLPIAVAASFWPLTLPIWIVWKLSRRD
jgi:hypothetical protein